MLREFSPPPLPRVSRSSYLYRLRCPDHKVMLPFPDEWKIVARTMRTNSRKPMSVTRNGDAIPCPVADCSRRLCLVKVKVDPRGSATRCTKSCVWSEFDECECRPCLGLNHGTQDFKNEAWWARF